MKIDYSMKGETPQEISVKRDYSNQTKESFEEVNEYIY